MLRLMQGDITTLDCDCIVNAANSALAAGGGVCGAIFRAAGGELRAECRALRGCPTGGAKITKGYNLLAKWIIHAVGPVYEGRGDEGKLLASCYRESLDLARVYGIKSIAFPAISTGIYGYPLREATEIAVSTARAWEQTNADYSMQIIFCCFDERTYRVYEEILTRG